MKRFVVVLPILIALGLAPKANAIGIEVNNGFSSSSFSGVIDDGMGGTINTTWTVGGNNVTFHTPQFSTDNSFQLFNDGSVYTPPSADVDRIATRFTGGGIGTTDTLTIMFDQEITNPVISFMNIDHSNWTIQNPGSSLTLLSQNGGLDAGLIASGIIQDATLNNATFRADDLGITSGSGSVQVNGTFTELNFLATRVVDRGFSTNIDGQRFQILGPASVVTPPPVPFDI